MKTTHALLLLSLFIVACGPQQATIESHTNDETAPISDSSAAQSVGNSGVASNYFGEYQIDDTGYGTEVEVVINQSANTRTIDANALPNHETGEFPNSGNPNTISAQQYTFRIPLTPKLNQRASEYGHNLFGVALNGVSVTPAEYQLEGAPDWKGMGLGMLLVLYAYSGWNERM